METSTYITETTIPSDPVSEEPEGKKRKGCLKQEGSSTTSRPSTADRSKEEFHDRLCTELQQLVAGLHRLVQNTKLERDEQPHHCEEEGSKKTQGPDNSKPKAKQPTKTFDSREQKLRKIFGLLDSSVGKDSSDGQIRKRELIVAVKKFEHIADFFDLPKRFLKDSETKALEAFFEGVDTSGDGRMTFEELRAWDVRRMAKKKEKRDPGEVAKKLLRCLQSIMEKQRRIFCQRMLQDMFFKHTSDREHQISEQSQVESQAGKEDNNGMIGIINNSDLRAMKELEMSEYQNLMTPRTRAKQEYWAIYHADTQKLVSPSVLQDKSLPPLLHGNSSTASRRLLQELKAEVAALKRRHPEQILHRCCPQEWDPDVHKAMGHSFLDKPSSRTRKGKAPKSIRRPAVRARGYQEVISNRARKLGFGSSTYARDGDSDMADSRRSSKTSASNFLENEAASDSDRWSASGGDAEQSLETIADGGDTDAEVEAAESKDQEEVEVDVEENEVKNVEAEVRPQPWKLNGPKLGGGISIGALPMGIGGAALKKELKAQLTPRTKKRMTVSVRRMSTAYSIPVFMSSSKEVLYGAVESGINPPDEQRDDDTEFPGEGAALEESFALGKLDASLLRARGSLGETAGTLRSLASSTANITFLKQRPARFPGNEWQAYGECKSSREVEVTPQHAYFQQCEKLRVFPKMPKFLTGLCDALEIPPQGPHGLTDSDLVATKSALIRFPSSIRSLDLSGSSAVSGQCIRDFWDGLPARTIRQLMSINFSRMRLGSESLKHFQEMIYENRFPSLQILSFDGVPIPDHAWHMFCRAMVSLHGLTELSLQNTTLGAAQQQSCLEVAWLVQNHTKLTKLNVSNNFFYFQGLQALSDSLAKNNGLRELCLAQNSSSQVPKSACSGISAMEFFCDSLKNNKGLEKLDLQGCGLTGAVDVILYEALKEHPRMKSLNLSDNPHGYQGLRCLVQLLVAPSCLISHCDVREVRDSVGSSPSTPIFNFSNPTGVYKLDLERPMNRVVLSLLLQVRDQQPQGSDEVFSEVTLDAVPVKNAPLGEACEKQASRGWKIAQEGRLCFRFTLALPPEHHTSKLKVEFNKGTDIVRSTELERWKEFTYRAQLERKVSFGRQNMNFQRFAVVATMLQQLENPWEQEMLIRALSSDHLLKVCHLKWLIQVTPADFAKSIGEHLWSTLSCPNVFDLFQLMAASRSSPAELHNSPHVMNSFFFNPLNPTGSYRLQLELPSSYSLGLRVLVINSWERKLAQERGLQVDTSQHGGHWGIRNLSYQGGMTLRYTESFELPIEGALTFDYTSVLRLDPSIMQATDNEVTQSLVSCLSNARSAPVDKIWALRSVSHMLVLSAEQIKALLLVVSATKHATKPPDFGVMQTEASRRLQPNTQLARSDLLVCLFGRCIDVANLVADQILGDQELFTAKQHALVVSRLGLLNAFNPLSCGGGKKYQLNFALHEERQLCSFLIHLGSQEEGEELHNVSWSGHDSQEGHAAFIVPSKWLTDIPLEGEFKCKYGVKRTDSRAVTVSEAMLETRKKLAADFFGFLYSTRHGAEQASPISDQKEGP